MCTQRLCAGKFTLQGEKYNICMNIRAELAGDWHFPVIAPVNFALLEEVPLFLRGCFFEGVNLKHDKPKNLQILFSPTQNSTKVMLTKRMHEL